LSTDAAELTFNHLREVNDARCVEWSGDTPWEPDTHLNEFSIIFEPLTIKKLHSIPFLQAQYLYCMAVNSTRKSEFIKIGV